MDLISLLSEHLPKKMLSSHSVFVDRVCQKEIQNIPFAKSAITAYSKISDKIGSLKLVWCLDFFSKKVLNWFSIVKLIVRKCGARFAY